MTIRKNKYFLILFFFTITFSMVPTLVMARFVPPPPSGRPAQEIGVFIWSSDVCTQTIIDGYKDVLEDEGYDIFFCFEDPNIYTVLSAIDVYERSDDTIFFYFYGHGIYKEQYDNSYWYYRPSLSISSYTLRLELDRMEAGRKGILIESCYSGGFADDFNAAPYFIISTSDTEHPSLASGPFPSQVMFSAAFKYYVDWDYSAEEAFDLACFAIAPYSDQNPQIRDNSVYSFFG